MNVAYNMDCLEAMREMPDNAYDLAVVDPPYGGGCTEDAYNGAIIGRFGGRFEKYHLGENVTIKATRTGGTWAEKYKGTQISVHRSNKPGGTHKNYDVGADIRHWDVAPPPEYFEQLFRVSKNQIIWGGNYFCLPPTRCFLVWRKLSISENFTMAMCEYAWTSFNDNAKVFEHVPQGKDRIHPCEKPVALYEWIYSRYAKEDDKILDTHLGSGTSRIAAYNLGFDFVGYEIDKVYFDLQEERFKRHSAQVTFFDLGANND